MLAPNTILHQLRRFSCCCDCADSVVFNHFAFVPERSEDTARAEIFMMEPKAEKGARELSVIQKAHDLILWYVPILNRLPRDHKFMLGDRLVSGRYKFHEGLVLIQMSIKQQKRRSESDIMSVEITMK